jgi:type II secretory pathway pseudopilin PulG
VIAVVAILGILFGIAIPSVIGTIEKSRRDVCRVNVVELERMYETYLELEDIEHSEVVFAKYLEYYSEDICPEDGEISYFDGRVNCSLHPRENGGGDRDSEGEGVPFI